MMINLDPLSLATDGYYTSGGGYSNVLNIASNGYFVQDEVLAATPVVDNYSGRPTKVREVASKSSTVKVVVSFDGKKSIITRKVRKNKIRTTVRGITTKDYSKKIKVYVTDVG